jgi:hypothetical protein
MPIMRYMQKRTSWNKGTSRIKTVRGKYDFYKGSRWSPVAGLLGSITLCLWLQFFGQSYNLSKMEVEAQEYKTPVVVVEERDKNYSEKQQILAYIVEVFGDDSADAITIINKCENHEFNPKATNWNRNGTWDTGIFQINQVHGYTMEEMQDWKQNIIAAKKIFDKAGKKWTAWSCAHVVGQNPFYLE